MRRVISEHERAYDAICDHMQTMYVRHEHAHYSYYRNLHEELIAEQSTIRNTVIDPSWVDDSLFELFEWWHLNMESTHDNIDDFVKENGI